MPNETVPKRKCKAEGLVKPFFLIISWCFLLARDTFIASNRY